MSVETDVSQGTTPEPSVGWGERLALTLLRLVVIVIVGALLGLLVGGVGGRLAMMLLARLSPEATGLTSDDGFVMGQFSASGTLNLLVVGTFLGAIGGVFYALLRGLMIGPRWFQVLSVGGGPAVVVGSMLVHTDGVDFRLLQPAWLAIALFVAIPGMYAALLTLVAERILRRGRRISQAPARETTRGWAATGATGMVVAQWAARLGLFVVFAAALVDLAKDTAELL